MHVAVPGDGPWAEARAVLRALRAAGHETYAAGGCVRDLLLGRAVHDVDVATAAAPEAVEALYPRTVAVGKAFGVIRIVCPGGDVEVATFRSDRAYVDGRRPTGIDRASAAEDVRRRDFTINALLLDTESGTIIDHVAGIADVRTRTLRAVGDAAARLAEDRLRVLRALRFAAVLGCTIEPATWAAVAATPLTGVSRERIIDELRKACAAGGGAGFLRLAQDSAALPAITPGLDAAHAPLLERLASAAFTAQLAGWLLPLGAERARAWIEAQPVPAAWRKDVPWLIAEAPGLTALPAGARMARLRAARGGDLAALATALQPERGADLALWLADARARPPCPLAAADLIAAGIAPGPALGAALRRAQAAWDAGEASDVPGLLRIIHV
jgi:tRNA nucleotidyltransferase/poly(A) polymerase